MVAHHDADKAGRCMTVADRIRATLTEAFAPLALEVVDESERHKGHAGARPGGETHFRVKITARAFRGKTRVQSHRMIYAALEGEIARGVHALAIEAGAPAEDVGRA
jgi:BolA family transcriptional regulator, general stress-responsive regulator